MENQPPVVPPASSLPPVNQFGHNEADAISEVEAKGQSRAYLVEYALVLITTGTILGVITTMLATIMKYTDGDRGYSFLDDYAYKVSVGLIAALVVSIPLLVLLTKRVGKSESMTSSLKNLSWRKGFLGVFLLTVSLYAIGYAIAFSYDLISYFASFGLGGDASSFPWRGLLENGLTALLFGATAWLYSYDYRDQIVQKATIAKAHHYGLIGLALLLTLIYFGTAFRQQRGEFIDAAIVSDIRSIQSKISSYESKNGELPESLDDLDLKDKQESRAKKFNYEYKPSRSGGSYDICADFKTDASKEDRGSSNPLEALSGASYYDDYSPSESEDPSTHGKGRQCFTEQTYSVYEDYDSGSSSSRAYESDQELLQD